MTYRVLVRRPAEQDIIEAQQWYTQTSIALALRLTEDLDRTLTFIGDTPYAAPVAFDDIRRRSLRTFPYHLWYLCFDDHQVVRILAVTHHRRGPQASHRALTR